MQSQIYLSQETQELLLLMRKRDPLFNLSRFIRDALLKIENPNSATILRNIEDSKQEAEAIQQKLAFWEEKYKGFITSEQEKLNQKAENEKKAIEADLENQHQKTIKEQAEELYHSLESKRKMQVYEMARAMVEQELYDNVNEAMIAIIERNEAPRAEIKEASSL